MAIIASVPQDRPYVATLASGVTGYGTYELAQAAAVALSAANSSAPVYTAKIDETLTSGSGGTVSLPAGNPQTWIAQLAATATYLPKDAARMAAFALSSANSGAPVYVGRTFQIVTGP